MTRVLGLLLMLLGLAFVPAQAQYLPRAELKKPLSPAVEKVLAEFLDRCATEKRAQLVTHMETIIAAVDGATRLTAAEKTAMAEPTRIAVEAAVQAWKPEAAGAMRVYLSRTSDSAAIRHIGQWKPAQAGPNEPVENWTPPQESPEWLGALRTTIGPERFDTWRKAYAQNRLQVDEEVSDYLKRWLAESRGAMNEDLQAKIGLMKTKLALPEETVEGLKKTAEALLDRLVEGERLRAAGMMRPMPDEARHSIMGHSSYYLRFDRPRGDVWEKLWLDTAAKVLGKDTAARWAVIAKEDREKEEAELAEAIKPSELYLRQQMEAAMTTEIASMTAELSLDKARADELKKLSEQAVEESVKQARKTWLPQARNYSAAERKRMRGNAFFGLSDELHASSLPVWKEGLKRLLRQDEMKQLSQEKAQRETRTRTAIARACVAELDTTVALSAAQRARLEPLVGATLDPLLDQRRQEYWSFSTQMLFQHANKVKEEALREILDETQVKRWQEALAAADAATRNVTTPGGTPPEVPDLETAVSEHLYKMFMAERKKSLSLMLPRVEEAERVLALPPPVVARLSTAAKGAVEQSLDHWRQNTERYVRQAVQSATPRNILQALAGTERVNFSRNNEKAPAAADVWQKALREELNVEQLEKLKAVMRARFDYRLGAMAGMTVGEVDRRRRLSGEQCVKLEAEVRKVLLKYLPDMERYMSANWFLQYYYAMVPVAGVAEKDLQAILTPQQWKLCKERDLPDAMQSWEGIENYHKSRLKQGGNAADIFGGGLFVE